MSALILGTYIQGESVIHRIDPRFKLVFSLVYFIAIFTAPGFRGLALLALFTGLVIALSKIPFRKVMKSVLPLIYVVVFAAIINLLFTNEGTLYVHWGIVAIGDVGLYNAAFYTTRLSILFVGMTMLALTTTAMDITDASERLLTWLKPIGVPVHELCTMFGISLRFLPVFADEFVKIKRAQESRGATFSTGGLIRRIKLLLPVVVPLFASAFRHAEGLALAMESRCYHGSSGRTRMYTLKAERRDWIGSALMIALLGVSIAMKVLL